MKESVVIKIGKALDLLAKANNAMIEAIESAVKDGDFVTYEETIDESCGVTELRFVHFNEDNELCVFDEGDERELYKVDDLTADQLYDICVKIS